MTRKELEQKAQALDLLVCTWSPGDGRTRYRFFCASAAHAYQNYFGPASGIYTAVGLRAAAEWLQGYQAGARNGAK